MIERENLWISEELSKQLLGALYGIDEHIGKLDEICSSIKDEPTRKQFVAALGELVGDIYFKLMWPIYRQHPSLGSPDEPGPWLTKSPMHR
jgi:hypothetical protein